MNHSWLENIDVKGLDWYWVAKLCCWAPSRSDSLTTVYSLRMNKLVNFSALMFLESCNQTGSTIKMIFWIYVACHSTPYIWDARDHFARSCLGSSLKSADGLGSSKLAFNVNSTRKSCRLSKALVVQASYR